MMIAIDFDGTLIDPPPNIPFKEILTYQPMSRSVKILNYLASKGFTLYVCSARPHKELKEIKKWTRRHGFPEMRVTNKKLPGTIVYIDDRCVRFTNWTDISKLFL